MLTILFDGVAYGMLLFILAEGLAVTMGLMNFINLAHGAFAMAGGYITVLLMQRLDVPFLVCLPIAFVGTALLGGVLERTLYRPLYHKAHLDQVLFSIGLVFMAVASVDYFVGSTQQIMQLPEWLKGRTEIGSGALTLGMGHYRLFIIAVCAALTVGLQYVLTKTRFGSRLRASVDDQRVAAGMGINVNIVFLSTFAFGSGLAGLGGALGAEVLGLDPSFPLKFMIYFLIVVAVGGTSSITGPLLAALLLGIADVAGKYYIPKLGAFIVYSLMILILIWRPQGLFVRKGGQVMANPQKTLLQARRFRWWEPMLWLLAFAAPLALPSHALIINEIAIVALFAISLDLILGYTGIVSLGHAAFFGMGGYAAALFAKHVMPAPLVGLAVGIGAATVLGAVASLTIMRGTDLTRLMVTLGVGLVMLELANKLDWLTGGADGLQGVMMGPVLGQFEFDLYGRTAAWYSLTVLLVFFLLARRIVQSPFGATLNAIRDNRLRAMAIGIPVTAKLAQVYTLAAALAGAAGALLTQTTGFASLDLFEFHRSADVMLILVIGGVGWLYGGILGAIGFKLLQDVISSITPQYWTFWVGLFLVVLVLVGRDRLFRPWTWFGVGRKAGAASNTGGH